MRPLAFELYIINNSPLRNPYFMRLTSTKNILIYLQNNSKNSVVKLSVPRVLSLFIFLRARRGRRLFLDYFPFYCPGHIINQNIYIFPLILQYLNLYHLSSHYDWNTRIVIIEFQILFEFQSLKLKD